MNNAEYSVGDTVELRDKEAGFTDPITGFDLSRDARKKLEEPIGERTHQALMSGNLLVVDGRPIKKDNSTSSKGSAAKRK
ncbi:MAG: hypothetical protein IPM50_02635 [Acidobacteriota bacterium]|nr:MAG: hypothetical protein IPM50_02635 [Acidobacteriota bacterium]